MGRSAWVGSSPGFRRADDGRVFIPTDSGERQYLETAPTTSSMHSNPGFEDETAGVPDNWDFTWYTGTPTISSEASFVYSGQRSLQVDLGAGSNHQIVLSDTFDVPSGGTVAFSTFAASTVGSPRIALGLLTRTSGTPLFLDEPASLGAEEAPAAVPTAWSMFRRRVDVPVGHTRGRIYFRISPAAAEACTVYLDLTASAVSGGTVYDSGPIALPYSAGWADTGSGWQPGQYQRVGDGLYLRGMGTRSGSASGVNAVIATLPVGFRPSGNNFVGGCYLPSSGAPVPTQVYINSAGEIITTVSVPDTGSVPFQVGPISLV